MRHPSTARGWDSTLRIGRMESIHGRRWFSICFSKIFHDMVQENPGEALMDQRNDSPQPKSLMSWFFYGRSLLQAIPTMFWNPRGSGWNNTSCPFIISHFLGFITIVTPFITMASRAHLVGSHSSRASEFRTRSLLRGWRMISHGRHPRKLWYYYSHSLKLWNRIWMMFAFLLLHPFPNLRLCVL